MIRNLKLQHADGHFLRSCTCVDSQRPLERLADVGFQNIADLDVVVAGDLDAAFEAGFDFLDIVLEPLERFEGKILGDDDAVADEANFAAALNVAVGDETAGDVADAWRPCTPCGFRRGRELFADFRFQESRERLFQIVENFVDDAVEADFDAALLGHLAGGFVGDNVESDDDGVGRIGQFDVAFVDAADGACG